MINGIGAVGMHPMAGHRPMNPPDPEEKFQELDADASGGLDAEELQNLVDRIAEMTGADLTADGMLARLDADGNGTLEMGEMPRPGRLGFQGPPPFPDGGQQPAQMEDFNPLESLLSYLKEDDEEESSRYAVDLQA